MALWVQVCSGFVVRTGYDTCGVPSSHEIAIVSMGEHPRLFSQYDWNAETKEQKPRRNRLVGVRFGARCRGRQTTSSCCLSKRFSAMMPFTPPEPCSLATTVSTWIRNNETSFMRQNVSRIPTADKISLAIDLGRKLRIGHPQVTARAV